MTREVSVHLLDDCCGEEGDHDFVVAGESEAPASALGGPAHDVRVRPVVLDKVHVHRGEVLERMAEIPGEGYGLEEYLGKKHRGAEVYVRAALEL